MAFFRGFLLSVFCAGVVLPAWSAADPACNIIQNFTSKSSADSFANKDIITCHKSGQKGFDFEVTPIEHAIDFNNVEAVRAILQRAPSKASSMVHTNKQTILDYVVQGCAGDKRYRKQEIPREQKRLEIIKLLIENGADVNTVAYDSKATMLDLATYKDRRDGNSENYDWTFCDQIAEVLLEHGAKTYVELNGDASAPGQGNTGTTGTPSSNATGGCTLEFAADGNRKTKLEHVESASMGSQCDNDGKDCRHTTWAVAGSYFFVTDDENNSDFALFDTDDEAPSLAKLIKINGESVDVGHLFEGSGDIYFECGKYIGVQYCLDGYRGENQLGLRLGDADLPVYEKCVKDEAGTDESGTKYKIEYDFNGGNADGTSLPAEYAAGEGLILKSTDPTKEGAVFVGWCLVGGDDQECDKFIRIGRDDTGDKKFIAKWESVDSNVVSGDDSDDTGTVTPPDNAEAIADAEKAYNAAHEKETSLANRMLGGASMAATGIGGMQLAQGLAEQSADKAAEADMQAYLATFTCKIGDAGGKSYKGGEMGIEVSGGNQLTSLYQQYVDLAADLKERKNALGMAPGIESTVIMDKANMGLYDAEGGKGIENGTYASLYRASKGNDADKQKLSDQKDTSANRVKGGAIAAGAGIVGGAIGNAIINSGDDDDDDIDLSKNGLDNFGYNLDGTCVRGKNESVAVTNNKCDSLTKRGTWWTSFSYGTVYGDAKCGTKAESPDKKQIPCSCKVTAVGDKKIDKAEWVYFASMNNEAGCKHACATRCASSVSGNESLRKKVLDSVDKKDSKLGAGLAGLGASLGSSLGSSVNLGNVASMASGLMSGSGQ